MIEVLATRGAGRSRRTVVPILLAVVVAVVGALVYLELVSLLVAHAG